MMHNPPAAVCHSPLCKIGVHKRGHARSLHSIPVHNHSGRTSMASPNSFSSLLPSTRYWFGTPVRIAGCVGTATVARREPSLASRLPTLPSLESPTRSEDGDCMQPGSGPHSPLDKAPIARLRHVGGLCWIVAGGICIKLLAHLGFVDDLCLISSNPHELQRMIDACQTWCEKSRMKINADKTKIVVFNPHTQNSRSRL